MALDPKEQRLAALSLFRGADEDAIKFLASSADEVDVAAGHVLIEQGLHNQEIYVLQTGSAVVEIDGVEVATIPAGEFFGELSYFNQTPASASVRTAELSTVMVIPHNRFGQVMEDNPRFVLALVTELAERLEATDLRLKTLEQG